MIYEIPDFDKKFILDDSEEKEITYNGKPIYNEKHTYSLITESK